MTNNDEEIGDLIRVAFNLLATSNNYDLDATMRAFSEQIIFALVDGSYDEKYFRNCFESLQKNLEKAKEYAPIASSKDFLPEVEHVKSAIENGKILVRQYPRD